MADDAGTNADGENSGLTSLQKAMDEYYSALPRGNPLLLLLPLPLPPPLPPPPPPPPPDRIVA